MPFGHLTLGDGEEAGEAGLGRQQIVVGRIPASRRLTVGQPESNRKQLPRRVEEERKVHRLKHGRHAAGQIGREVLQPDRQRHQRTGEVAAVHC